ncbi:kynurenine formamidase [Novosphingobium fuchskuhlense]|uniref:Kynurenine formamidase n=1 Tax=Novosphingobium fuchskuhlense TaxID=1117702 RepID=A0A117UTL7_9SPHN|nr:kynurenine formamidase [Novosphingobium fuchskuhlense]
MRGPAGGRHVRIIDISQRLDASTPLWPGEPALVVSHHARISETCSVNVGAVHMALHSGTHADAPFHYDVAGQSSAETALEPYIGRCVVVDVRRCAGSAVDVGDIDWSTLAAAAAPRVLLRTYEGFPHAAWDAGFRAVSAEVIRRLAGLGVVLVGTDAASLDPQDSKTMEAHHAVRAADMRILEGLVLDGVAAGVYELIALPLPLAGADASPVRAVLREIAA